MTNLFSLNTKLLFDKGQCIVSKILQKKETTYNIVNETQNEERRAIGVSGLAL